MFSLGCIDSFVQLGCASQNEIDEALGASFAAEGLDEADIIAELEALEVCCVAGCRSMCVRLLTDAWLSDGGKWH